MADLKRWLIWAAILGFNLWCLWHLNAWQMKHRGWSGRLIERAIAAWNTRADTRRTE